MDKKRIAAALVAAVSLSSAQAGAAIPETALGLVNQDLVSGDLSLIAPQLDTNDGTVVLGHTSHQSHMSHRSHYSSSF